MRQYSILDCNVRSGRTKVVCVSLLNVFGGFSCRPASHAGGPAARAECGDDRTFRHILPFSLSYGRVGARIHDDWRRCKENIWLKQLTPTSTIFQIFKLDYYHFARDHSLPFLYSSVVTLIVRFTAAYIIMLK